MDYQKHEIPKCDYCQKPANQTCGGCKLVYYCSRAHQKFGWRDGHKKKCCCFKVQYTDTLGRHMVATRDIKPGEIILKEKPAVFGPRMACPPQCLGCDKKLIPIEDKKKLDFYKCSSCNWPMCGPECETADVHIAECKLMKERKYKSEIKYEQMDKPEAAYCVIAPLRVLLMKETNPLQYENVMALESHLEERINTPLYAVLKANIVTFITQVLGIHVDEDLILRIASIFDTNSFDVRSGDNMKRVRAIYVTASMMNHSCRPNTKHVYLGDDYNFALIATVPISKGDLITVTYTQCLWSTLDRIRHLRTTKCFDCDCERCKDPTEFGTYFSSIYCSVCYASGVSFGPETPKLISTNPLDEDAEWKCEKCGHSILGKQIDTGNSILKQELNKLDKNSPKGFEEFLQKYQQTLHPTNHLVVQAKLVLYQIYGNLKGFALNSLPNHLLKRKIDLCYELLEIADKLDPGWSKFRGTILLDLQAALTVQAKRGFESKVITKDGTQDQLNQSLQLLQEAADILNAEPHMREAVEEKIRELLFLIESSETTDKVEDNDVKETVPQNQ